MSHRYVTALAIAASTALAGCAEWKSIYRTSTLGENQAIITDAKQRVVLNTAVGRGSRPGQVVANRVVCAEPSPDVAQALSSSLSASLEAAVAGQGQGAAEFASSTAESVAQLGARLATIQVLRDGLYRACEAYANGALSSASYAMIIAGYDDTLATTLLGEFVAGSPAGGTVAIQGSASAQDVVTDAAGLSAAAQTLEAKRQELAAAETALQTKGSERRDLEAQGAEEAQVQAAKDQEKQAKDDVDAKVKAVDAAKADVDRFLGKVVKSSANVVSISGQSNDLTGGRAQALTKMHAKFMDHDGQDFGPIVSACVTALDDSAILHSNGQQVRFRDRPRDGFVHTAFAQWCWAQFFPTVMEGSRVRLMNAAFETCTKFSSRSRRAACVSAISSTPRQAPVPTLVNQVSVGQ